MIKKIRFHESNFYYKIQKKLGSGVRPDVRPARYMTPPGLSTQPGREASNKKIRFHESNFYYKKLKSVGGVLNVSPFWKL
jgi:hypothetical protein